MTTALARLLFMHVLLMCKYVLRTKTEFRDGEKSFVILPHAFSSYGFDFHVIEFLSLFGNKEEHIGEDFFCSESRQLLNCQIVPTSSVSKCTITV